MEQKKIVIIGGGVIGLCAAYFLQKDGHSVTLIEQKELGFGSSTGNAGLIVPSHFVPLAAPGAIAQGMKWMFDAESPFYIKPRMDLELLDWLWKFRGACTAAHVKKSRDLLLKLHLSSKQLFGEISQSENIDFGLTKRGLLMLCNTDSGWHELEELVEQGQQMGLDCRMMTAPEVHEMDETVQTSAKGGAYFPEDAHIDPGKFLTEMTRLLRENGVEIHTGVSATGFAIDKGMVTAARTNRGDFRADEFLITGGAFSPIIAKQLRLKLPIQPGKGYSVTIKPGGKMLQTPLILEEARVAVTPMGDKLRFAGTMELGGLNFNINQRRVNAILKAIPRYLPEIDLSKVDSVEPWAGLRPVSPDGLPYIGKISRYKNVLVAAGHAMIGISLAPETGKLAADLAAKRSPEIDISALAVERFS